MARQRSNQFTVITSATWLPFFTNSPRLLFPQSISLAIVHLLGNRWSIIFSTPPRRFAIQLERNRSSSHFVSLDWSRCVFIVILQDEDTNKTILLDRLFVCREIDSFSGECNKSLSSLKLINIESSAFDSVKNLASLNHQRNWKIWMTARCHLFI